jgi:hypothetical protein
VIEPIHTLQAPLQHGHLIGLALQIGVQMAIACWIAPA